MFDIGFFELLMLALVGLFVIGPERLPGTIRTCALWFGRIKRNLLDTRQELEKHIGADEIRRELQNEQVMHNLAKMKNSRDELAKKIQDWQDGNFEDGNSDEKEDENDPYGDKLHHDDEYHGDDDFDEDHYHEDHDDHTALDEHEEIEHHPDDSRDGDNNDDNLKNRPPNS